MTVKCPKCGRMLEVSGAKPGSSVTCQCGNMVVVPKKTPWLIILLGLGVLGCMCTGILAAIAIPNFIKFQSRAKQAECRTYLKTFYVAQRTYNMEGQGYPRELSKAGFSPERGNRYAYFVGRGPMEDRSGPQATGTEEAQAIGVDTARYPDEQPITFEQLPASVAQLAGLSGECPDCNITMVCAGNIDRDSTLDVWSVSTGDRTLGDGTSVPAGEPFQHVNDVTD
jgi:type IV pilus assembly protein PilA